MNSGNDIIIREPVGRLMNKISRMFLASLHKNLAHLDIERSFYPLVLIEAGNGNLTQKDLAEKLSCGKVQVVRIINYLSLHGYVKRGENTSDRRKCSLEITDKARKYLPDIKKALEETTSIVLQDIPESKIDELYNLLTIMNKNLSSHNHLK